MLDQVHAGRSLSDVCEGLDGTEIPIVGSLEGVASPGDEVVIGFPTNGGLFTPEQREVLGGAAGAGLRVVNGLHEPLELPNVVNLRAFDPADRVLATGAELRSTRVLTVGTSSAVGKMTTTLLLARALQAQGVAADWLATGQTGLFLRGFGHVIDSVPVDFVPGVIERDLLELERKSDVIVIEGQGSLTHPAFGPSTFALFQASRPQWYLICHRIGMKTHIGFAQPVPSVAETVEAHEQLARTLGIESRLLGVCVDSADLPPEEYARERRDLEAELAVPCCDPVRDGTEPLIERLLEGLRS